MNFEKFLRTHFPHPLRDCVHGFISVTYLVSYKFFRKPAQFGTRKRKEMVCQYAGDLSF